MINTLGWTKFCDKKVVISTFCDKKKKCDEKKKQLKPHTVTKLKNSNCDQTQELKLWEKKTQKLKLSTNSKTQVVTKPKNSKCNRTQKPKLWQISKSKIMTKLKMLQNSNSKTEMWQNTKCDKT